MERKYRDITSGAFDSVHDDSDYYLIFMQIAYNLAHIADELAESNRIRRDGLIQQVQDAYAKAITE